MIAAPGIQRQTPPLARAVLSDETFQKVARLAAQCAGLSIPASKKALVQSRLSKRMRMIGITDFDAYLGIVASPDAAMERREFVSVLTTNVTSFFREKHHFDHLARHVIPRLAQKLARGEPVRLWSAGCSSGQEPISIAIECLRAIPDAETHDLLVLATDIDGAILKKAETAQFANVEMSGLDPNDRKRFFTHEIVQDVWVANDAVRKIVRFKQLNLHNPWPMRGRFDAIFCRNVVIYFDEVHQRELWPRFHAALARDGIFYLGHSERIHALDTSGFCGAGVTTYRKT